MGKSFEQKKFVMQNRTHNSFNHVLFTCSAEKREREDDDEV